MPNVPVVSREEMEQVRVSYNEAWKKYCNTHFNFLTTILKEAGFYNKLVKLKDSELRGQFKVSTEPYGNIPWTIKFFPERTTYKGISSKSKNVRNFYPWQEDTLVEQLKEIAEVVGDLP